MAIIQIETQNPDFGFIIRKNPASGMQLKSIRQGTAFGWYSNNDTTFNIFFKDADNAVSFGDQEFEYLNTTRYNSPIFVLSAISEFFSSTVKEQIDIDKEGDEKSFMVNMVDVRYMHQIKHFEKYFPEFKIELEHYVAKSYKLKITTSESFHKLFNYMNLMMMFLALTSEEYIQLDQTSVEKYLNSIERLDAPFFIRYLFSRNMFRSRKQFDKYKNRLEETKLYTYVNMSFGDTAIQRRNRIRKMINFDRPILDVGCGEGFYAIPFAMDLGEDKTYHAIDIEKPLTDLVEKKAAKKDLKNIRVYNHIDEFVKKYDGEPFDVILTEVIEHMPIEESRKLIQKIVNSVNFDKFIITVPNKDFNQFYMIGDDEFRHDDHDWEPTKLEFVSLMQDEIPFTFKMDFVDIGDTVDGISTSIGCIVTKV
jgi:SAM-dependent methyltransferase